MSADQGSGIDRGDALFSSFTRTSDATAAGKGATPPTPPPAAPAESAPPVQSKFIWCSDCRSAIRTHYFALDTRPLCGKCRVEYARAIEHARGSAGFREALVKGGGIALACAAGLGLIFMIMPVFRILLAIGVGHLVGTAVNKATGDYTMRRYQVLAALLTYFAIGLGSLAPVVKEIVTMPAAVEAPAADAEAEAAAAAADEESEEEAYAEDEEEAEVTPGLDTDELEAEYRRNRAEQFRPPVTAEESSAQSVRAAGFVKGFFMMLVLILILPLLSLFSFGLYGIAIGLLSLGYGIYKAWDITASGHTYQIAGPYRVGTGPIPLTMG